MEPRWRVPDDKRKFFYSETAPSRGPFCFGVVKWTVVHFQVREFVLCLWGVLLPSFFSLYRRYLRRIGRPACRPLKPARSICGTGSTPRSGLRSRPVTTRRGGQIATRDTRISR